MSTHKHFDKICIAVLICAILITLLFMNGERFGLIPVVDEDAEGYEGTEYFTANDLDGAWDASEATVITLSGDEAKIKGSGAYADGGSVYIKNGGRYVLSGELTDGSIVVDAYASSKIWLMLDGANISCLDDAGLIVMEADKVFVTLADGSDNSVTSGANYSEEALADKRSGAVFAHDDLTINGSGSLAVTAEYKHGIKANDDLVIAGGNITITSEADGIHVNEDFRMTDADVTISAGDDGIHADKEILIAGGTLLIEDCYEGLEAVTIEQTGGDITIYPEDDGFNANGGSGDMFGAPGGGFGGPGGGQNRGTAGFGTEGANSTSAENMANGDAAGNAAAAESVSSGDAAGNAGSTEGESEMPRRPEMTAQNTEDSEETDVDGEDADEEDDEEDDETYIKISGGTTTIINANGRDADGLDSNGDIYISGGTIRVSLTGSGTNCSIDYASESGGVCEISGGTVIAAGSSGMAEQFDETSEQCAILYTYSATAPDNTTVALKDSSGKVLLQWEVPYSFSSVNLSCPELKIGETYLVAIGDEEEEVTLSEVSSTGGDAAEGGFGGRMGQGGPGGMMGQGGSGSMMKGGGFGGRGMRQHGMNGEMPTPPESASGSGEMPSPPEGASGNGEMPTPPEGTSGNGEMPTPPEGASGSGEMPTPPEGASEAGNAGDGTEASQENSQGQMEHASGRGMPPGDMQNTDEAEEDTAESAGISLSEVDTDTWKLLAATAAILIAGLGFAFIYRRR